MDATHVYYVDMVLDPTRSTLDLWQVSRRDGRRKAVTRVGRVESMAATPSALWLLGDHGLQRVDEASGQVEEVAWPVEPDQLASIDDQLWFVGHDRDARPEDERRLYRLEDDRPVLVATLPDFHQGCPALITAEQVWQLLSGQLFSVPTIPVGAPAPRVAAVAEHHVGATLDAIAGRVGTVLVATQAWQDITPDIRNQQIVVRVEGTAQIQWLEGDSLTPLVQADGQILGLSIDARGVVWSTVNGLYTMVLE